MRERIFFLGAVFSLATAAVSQENYTLWSQTSNITINTSATGMNVPGNVRKFPYLVRLDSVFNFTQSIGQGIDVRFSKPDGTPLKYQRERWDSAGRRAEFWVLLDTVYGNNATQLFRMHWGRAAAGDSSRGAAVFDTANGFVGVWHLRDTADATINANHGMATNTNVPSNTNNGIVGPAKMFNSQSTAQFISVPNSPSLNFENDAITMSMWINPTSFCPCGTGAPANRRLIQKGPGGGQYRISELTDIEEIQFDVAGITDGTDLGIVSLDSSHFRLNAWTLIHGTYDGTRVKFYVNGIARVNASTWGGALMAGSTDLRIGGDPTTGTTARDSWYGLLDEVRIHKVGRDSNWIKLEFLNQRTASVPLVAPAISYVPATIVDTVGKAASHAVRWGSKGGFVDTYSIAPALTQGLSLNPATGLISGSPTGTLASTAYTVTATGPGGTATTNVTLSIIVPVGVKGAETPASGFSIHPLGKGLLFDLPGTSSSIQVSITDVWGRTVWSQASNGSSQLAWDGRAANGRQAAKGVYVVRMSKAGEPGGPVLKRTVTFSP